MTVACADEDSGGILLVALPVGNAAQGAACFAQVVFPDFLAAVGFEGDDRVVDGGRIEHAANDNRDGFGSGEGPVLGVGVVRAAAPPVLPGKFQVRDVLGVDL